MNRKLVKTFLYGILIVAAAITLAPLLWMLSASFMPNGEASTFPPPFFPKNFTFEHYVNLFTRGNLARYLFNSAFLSVAVTFISLIINSMAGYAFAAISGMNLHLHRSGRRPDPAWESFALAIPSLLSRAEALLADEAGQA